MATSRSLQTDLIGTRVSVDTGYSGPQRGVIRAVTYDTKEQNFMYAILMDDGHLRTFTATWFTVITDKD